MTLSAEQLERCMLADLANDDIEAFLAAFRTYATVYPCFARLAEQEFADVIHHHQEARNTL